MAKKINLLKLLNQGSARERAALLIYHYTVLDAINRGFDKNLSRILTDNEAEILFDSFKESKEKKIYNDYWELNANIVASLKNLFYTGLQFEKEYYKYLYKREIEKSKKEGDDLFVAILAGEDFVVLYYSRLLDIYTALKIYAKKKRYANKFIIDRIDGYFTGIQDLYNSHIIPSITGQLLSQRFASRKPDYEEIQKILLAEFNYKYEKETE